MELRLRNHADRDEDKNCIVEQGAGPPYETAARRFGGHRWPQQAPCATSRCRSSYGMADRDLSRDARRRRPPRRCSPTAQHSCAVRRSNMGPGTLPSMTQVSADTLAAWMEHVRFTRDTDLPMAPTTSQLDHDGGRSATPCGRRLPSGPAKLRRSPGAWRRRTGRRGFAPGLDRVEAEAEAKPGDHRRNTTSSAFGAVFVEVASIPGARHVARPHRRRVPTPPDRQPQDGP